MVVLGGRAVSYGRGTPVGISYRCEDRVLDGPTSGEKAMQFTRPQALTPKPQIDEPVENYGLLTVLAYSTLQVQRNSNPTEQLLGTHLQRLRGGLVCEADRLCVSLNSRLESNKEREEESTLSPHAHTFPGLGFAGWGWGLGVGS